MGVQSCELLSRLVTSCVVYFFSTDGPVEQHYLSGGNAGVFAAQEKPFLFSGMKYPNPEHAKTVLADPQYWSNPFVRRLFRLDYPFHGNRKNRRMVRRRLRQQYVDDFLRCGDMGKLFFGVCEPCGALVGKPFRAGGSSLSYKIGCAELTKSRVHPKLANEIDECIQHPDFQAFLKQKPYLINNENIWDRNIYIEYRCMYEHCFSRAIVVNLGVDVVVLNISEEALLKYTPFVPPQWSMFVNEKLFEIYEQYRTPIDEYLLWDCFDKDGRIIDKDAFTKDVDLARTQFKQIIRR